MARQSFVGLVISHGKMDKTIKVRIQRQLYDNYANKFVIKRKDMLVHDEGNLCRSGDIVTIEATRPLSTRKSFAVSQIRSAIGQKFLEYETLAKESTGSFEQKMREEFVKARDAREKSADRSLVDELTELDKLLHKQLMYKDDKSGEMFTAEDAARLEELKALHNIDTMSTKDVVFDTEIKQLRQDLDSLKTRIENTGEIVQAILEDENKTMEVLKRHGVADPSSVRPNVKKNIVRRYVLTTKGAEKVLEK